MVDYDDKLDRERQWYIQSTFKPDHFLNSSLFFSPERNMFNYIFPKIIFYNHIRSVVHSSGSASSSILVAPVGNGDDLKYLRPISDDLYGIDISEEAIDQISDGTVKKSVGDMSNMSMFTTNQFDIVVVPLFFHHFLNFGFESFLSELHRVLKPGGHFFSLEPNSLYPISWLSFCAKKLVGNITGAVEDEAPFVPFRLSRAMTNCGFREVRTYGASFTHNRIPICLAKINNTLTFPLLRLPFFRYIAWMCVFHGIK